MINLTETFEHFPQAPAIEAVLDIRARATVDLTEQRLREAAQRNLPTYEFLDSQREIKHEVRFSTTQGEEIQQGLQDLGWKGMRFRSTDRRHIVNIHRDGMIFSRLSPYQDWDQFQEEGLRLWDFSTHLTKPETISRIGVRFINQIILPQGEVNFESYMTSPPSPPENMSMPFLGFLHHVVTWSFASRVIIARGDAWIITRRSSLDFRGVSLIRFASPAKLMSQFPGKTAQPPRKPPSSVRLTSSLVHGI